jgi:hypothetical protein
MRWLLCSLRQGMCTVCSKGVAKCGLVIALVLVASTPSRADYIAFGSVERHYTMANGRQPISGATVTISDSKTGQIIGIGQTNKVGVFRIYCRTNHNVPVGNHKIKAVYRDLSGSWGREMISISPQRPIALGIRAH